MRVALLCLDRGIPLGGTDGDSIHLRAVAGALLRAGHRVQALFASEGSARGCAPLIARGLEVTPVPAPVTVRELQILIGRTRPDVLLERLSPLAPEGAEAASRLGTPHVYEVAAPFEEGAREGGARELERMRRFLANGLAASAGAIAFSEQAAVWVRRHAPADYRVRLVQRGVSPEFFTAPPPETTARAARELRASPGLRVAYAGSFHARHDLGTLVHALALLTPKSPCHLVAIGDGPLANPVLRQATGLGVSTAFVGRVPHHELPAYLALCDVAAVTCAREASCPAPLRLIEAMASGRAVVASASPSWTPLVRDGVEALLVPPGDPEALAAALLQLATVPELRTELGDAARRAALQRHSWDRVVPEVLEFARECADAQRAS